MINYSNPEKPIVTVITLSYQSEYIYETINSILNQMYGRIQYIISDDGSEDFSVEDIRNYINDNNRGNICDLIIHHNTENVGTVRNLNQALSFAKGDIILYLSADDLFYDQKVIDDWVEFFSDGKYQIATALRAVYDDKTNNFIETLPSEDQIQMILAADKEILFDELTKVNFIFHCNIAFTKRFLETYMPYDDQYHLIEDHPMNLRWIREGVVFGFLNRISIKYRCGGVSAPINVNKTYLKDVKQIYRKEVFPYTSHPYRARYYHMAWTLNHINECHFIKEYAWCKEHHGFLVLLSVLHPVRACRKVKRTVKTIIQKWRKI